ncbi:glycosyltransferase family 39 protein [Butyrivibrio sp. YAB3001]|uniref:glycosyltransferase family 39 protein n=1 Tax=Butyrivibrio sp. YAB3001 TaxID=1520812 RepID=UPI0008F61CF5|nr:glycosyltransferase family 39 protein [Butyrivibrio sp. YAB3001]SFC77373.1 Dolichyl-phosphate-mannose-protein mannosyltransferase [Butyrivibrio sp. YAB3001]
MIKNIFTKLVTLFLFFAALAVFITSFFTTIYYDMNVDVDFPHYKAESISHLAISMVAVFLLAFFFYKKKMFESSKAFILFALFFCSAYCLFLIISIKPLPVSDAAIIDEILEEFKAGDYSALTAAGGYLNIWPFQMGYVLFAQIMDALFGHGNYFAWNIAQLLSILLTVYLLYNITWELFEDKEICGIVALLSMGMLFFYNYVTFIYGDILSMGPQTLALYLTVLYVKREKLLYAILVAPVMALSILIKTNCEIALIAVIMIIIFSSGKEISGNSNGYRSYELLRRILVHIGLSFLIIATVLIAKNAVDSHYLKVSGLKEMPGGSPSVSHIAMGLQESELEDGWYNRYNYDVFAENDFNTEKTRQAAIQNIRERLIYFKENPGYAIKFMARKFLTQWADPVCISTHNLDLVSRHVENPTTMMYYIVFGHGSIIIRWIMNVYMSVCYLCVLACLGSLLLRKEIPWSVMLLLILIFGGICFHQFWEGSSRYAMRYYVYWTPYAAFGMKTILEKFCKIGVK